MGDKEDVVDNNLDVEEGPLEETIDSPRFYNLTVEETQDNQLASFNDRSRIVFSPGTKDKNNCHFYIHSKVFYFS